MKKAFTLIELIVVIALISIISSIAFLKFNIIKRARNSYEINTMINDINFAKEKSMATGMKYEVIFEDDSYQVRMKGRTSNISQRDKIQRNLSYLELKDMRKILTYLPEGSVSGADTIVFLYKEDINGRDDLKLVISVVGGYVRYE